MGAFLKKLWNDPAYFVGMVRATLVVVGGLFSEDLIPTGVDGLGHRIARILLVVAVAIPAGNKTPLPEPAPAPAKP